MVWYLGISAFASTSSSIGIAAEIPRYHTTTYRSFTLYGSNRRVPAGMDRHMAPSTSPVALPGGYSTIITAQTLAISVGLFLIYWILRGIYSIYIYPFHASPLRHLPTPMV